MLLEKSSFNENDIVTIKLISGEEVIGKFIKDNDEILTLEKPLMLAMSQQGIGMVPLLVTVNPDTKLHLNKTAVILIAESDKEIANQYVYQTTGIRPVQAGSILV
jgi:hypothetical protein